MAEVARHAQATLKNSGAAHELTAARVTPLGPHRGRQMRRADPLQVQWPVLAALARFAPSEHLAKRRGPWRFPRCSILRSRACGMIRSASEKVSRDFPQR